MKKAKHYYLKQRNWLFVITMLFSITILTITLSNLWLDHKLIAQKQYIASLITITIAIVLLIITTIHWHKITTKRSSIIPQIPTNKKELDPHFLFNSLNAIAGTIILKENQKAYTALIQYSRLLRSMLETAGTARTLEQELEFTKYYLDLEQLSTLDQLKYNIKIGPDVDHEIKVPRMIFTSYLNEIINTRVNQCASTCNITIEISRINGHLQIIFTDDITPPPKRCKHSQLKQIHNYFNLHTNTDHHNLTAEEQLIYDLNQQPCGHQMAISLAI